MIFNINDYKGKYVMHCKTKEEAIDFCKYLHSVGRKWSSERKYSNATNWDDYKEKTVYYFNQGLYCGISSAIRDGYAILEWSDFMNSEFTKADLKNSDVVLHRNGEVGIVCIDTGTIIFNDGFNNLDDITENLFLNPFDDEENCEYDIMAVRRPEKPADCRFSAFEEKFGKLVYERKEVEEMTLDEICRALGKTIKIVDDNNRCLKKNLNEIF